MSNLIGDNFEDVEGVRIWKQYQFVKIIRCAKHNESSW
jgi:hypothetical protein